MNSIFDYINYRLYLKDFLAEKKKKKVPEYSHKAILSKLNITSTGFISNILAGRKNLTPIQTSRMTEILKLKRPEASYFETMVLFTHARTIEEKNEYLHRLSLLQHIKLKQLDPKKFSLFSKTHYVFLRTLLNFYRYSGDDKALAGKFLFPVSEAQIRDAVNTLERLGLIIKKPDGTYKEHEAALTTGDEVKSIHLANFQLETLEMAKQALKKISAAQRDISVLTLSLSDDNFRLLKSEIQHFRKRMAKIAIEDENPQKVYQMNLQLFPVTKGEE